MTTRSWIGRIMRACERTAGLSAALFHPAVGTAQRFLASAFDSVESMLQWQETAAQMAIDMVEEAEDDPDFATRTEETAQDMLRATIVFAGAGLDSAVKQLIHDALPTLLNISTQAADKFVQHVETVIAEQSSTRTLARVLIHAENPRTALIEGYVDALTGSSLQSVEQLDRVIAAMGINDSELRRRVRTLRPLFIARNEIVHELDLLRPQGEGPRRRRIRDLPTALDLAHAGLEVGQLTINGVVTLLHAAGAGEVPDGG